MRLAMVLEIEYEHRHALQRRRAQLAHGGEAFERVLRLASRLLDCPMAVLAMAGLERHYFRARLNLDVPEMTYNIAFFAQAMATSEPLIVPDLLRDPRFCDHALVSDLPQLRFYAAAAVRDPQGMPIGALCAVDVRPRTLSGDAVAGLSESLADIAAVVDRELLMRTLTRTDPLTGLHNSSYAELDIEREWQRARRGHYPVTVLMIDVDHLSVYNDSFGYPAGDRALRAVAERLVSRFRRSSDQLIRMGGDRILVLLPDTTAEDGARLAEGVRTEIESLGLGNPEAGARLTLSVGCASASRQTGYHDGYQALIRRADAALRGAKAAGRNRAQLYAPATAGGGLPG